ncbi:S8 family serine peptidase [Devosia sp. Root413D1]|uniref:S8 family serine peptidase n=1 Tax=Devosia sp. Root413D1 TaxID=1736531 RepID=UPI0012E3B5B0|nr:S8 family serine peptidase [Devosia sp. Root413D1]
MFEVTGSVTDFAKAAANIPGLSFAGEDTLDEDEEDEEPTVYLLVPDLLALRQILGLWQRWQRGDKAQRGFAPWGHLFSKLRDVRPWGPSDRVQPADRSQLAAAYEGVPDRDLVRLECEMVFRPNAESAALAELAVRNSIAAGGGRVVHSARHPEFSYHAVLLDLPASGVRRIVELDRNSLAGLEPVLSIYPQSLGSTLEVEDAAEAAAPEQAEIAEEPVVAVFDAVPLQAHPWLAPWLNVVDPYGLDQISVGRRVHGTAMASIVIHGDRSVPRPPIGRRLYFRSVMFAPAAGPFGPPAERFVDDRLIVDVMVEAVRTMRGEGGQRVVVVNLSLGDTNKRFADRLSPWARALDYLSVEYGLLFVVSSGNVPGDVDVPDFPGTIEFESAPVEDRAAGVFKALDAVKADRRILSPSESINALTIGAWHNDPMAPVALPNMKFFPYPDMRMPNVSSALGLGHRRSIKPEALYPGGREHLNLRPGSAPATVRPHAHGNALGGMKVAAPPGPGQALGASAWTIGSSGAAAYATHAAHKLHDSLEAEYGEAFAELPNIQRAAILKALLIHPASWGDTHDFIIRTKFPVPQNWETMRREVSRHLGYGFVEPDDCQSCAADRATMWASSRLLSEQAIEYSIPLPDAFSTTNSLRAVYATLAWFSPVRPGHQLYRAAKLKVLPLGDDARAVAGVATTIEPPYHQTEAGTVVHRRWAGTSFGHAGAGGTIRLQVQREKDQGGQLDDAISFGLAVTVSMDGRDGIYDEVLTRVAVKPRSRTVVAI